MSPTAEGAGVPLAYDERGAGPAVLVVHDIGGRGDVPEVPGARVVAYDRRGYGGSGAPEPYGRTTVAEQAQDALALLEALDAAPAVVWGEGFGALVALYLAWRHAAVVRGLVLIDPPVLAFVPEAAEALAAERGELEERLRADGPRAAAAALLRGRGVPAERAEAAAARPRAVFADYGAGATLEALRRDLRAVAAPAAVVVTDGAAPPVRAAAAALLGVLPAARRAPGAAEAAAAMIG